MLNEEQVLSLVRIVRTSGVAEAIEAKLPVGVRPRQLKVETFLVGMMLCQADGRPAHLVRVLAALSSLGDTMRKELGVVAEWTSGPHRLTYRQVEYTLSVIEEALAEQHPDGKATAALQEIVDGLLEASVPTRWKKAGSSYAVDWSDIETFSLPPREKGGDCSDPEASWGHRRGDAPGESDELFFGYYFQLATMVHDEDAPEVPELVRRMCMASCTHSPPELMASVLVEMASSGVHLGDVLADIGYAHKRPEHWALPLRLAGAELVQDLHPADRGTKGTHGGAVCCNGNLYCPATPSALFSIQPLSRSASPEEKDAHDTRSAELASYKLGRLRREDADGYRRVCCPAVLGKIRCPLRPESMSRPLRRPEILTPPEHPALCCVQRSLSVPPSVNAKTVQKHDYPSKAHRRSYGRRAAAERSNSTLKDRASIDVERGWCRVMGLTAMTLFLACAVVVRNGRILEAFAARQLDQERRKAAGLPPRTRRRRRRTLADLAAGGSPP